MSAALRCPRLLENDEERSQARALLRRLESQLVRIEVYSPDAYTEILFNGARWFSGADALMQRKMAYPGQYEITARRPGYITVRKPLDLSAGEQATIRPLLVSIRDATTETRRWTRWKPWLAAGASVAVVALGVGLEAKAAADFRDFDARWKESCSAGCRQSDEPEIKAGLDRAERYHVTAQVALAVGTASLLTSSILLWLNRPRPYLDESAGHAPVDIVPMVAPGTAGMSARVEF